ncbi:MAG: hypothetical protein M3552_04040 [Planctomycetota bacterium]|nr:hypothetical protein [Planctomycetota bacterium]
MFLELLPEIERRLRWAFRELTGDAKAEALQEATCHACRAYARLAEQKRGRVATAKSLARFAVRQFHAGRRVGHGMNINDVYSEYCQRRRGLRVRRLDNNRQEGWQDMLVEDHTVTPAELAASRIDYPAFLDRLDARKRLIAETLASGEATGQVAKQFGISFGRVSQLRHELCLAWQQFHGSVEVGGRAERA